jgi:hypothetical protein
VIEAEMGFAKLDALGWLHPQVVKTNPPNLTLFHPACYIIWKIVITMEKVIKTLFYLLIERAGMAELIT